MKQFFICLFSLTMPLVLPAQTTATFETFDLPAESYLDGSDGSGGFNDGNIFLPNVYNSEYASWSGWAVSNTTDTLTAGFMNQYSAITGGGYDNSENYAITYAGFATNLVLSGPAAGGTVAGFYATNNTYAYLSMLNGDGFAKKFGGETGDDPDFLLLTIKKYLNGELSSDSVDFYLADFRFEDNSQDYIVKDWTYIDLTGLGDADSLQFLITGSDVGQYGLNTPAYLCLDNLTTLDQTTPVRDHLRDVKVTVFPNPTSDRVTVKWPETTDGAITVYSASGEAVRQAALQPGDNPLSLHGLPGGHYTLVLRTARGWSSQKLIKH